MTHRSLLVFDIETVPDTDALPNLTGFEDPDVGARRAELERYHLEVTHGANPFPRQPFHRVVAIAFLEAEIQTEGGVETYLLRELRSGGEANWDEKKLIQGFFAYVQRSRPRLVSFNGRTFDLPGPALPGHGPRHYRALPLYGRRQVGQLHAPLQPRLALRLAGRAVRLRRLGAGCASTRSAPSSACPASSALPAATWRG